MYSAYKEIEMCLPIHSKISSVSIVIFQLLLLTLNDTIIREANV